MRVQAEGTDRLRCVPRTAQTVVRRARGSHRERWGSPSRRGQGDVAGVRCTARGRDSASSRCAVAWLVWIGFSSCSRDVLWWTPGGVHRRQGAFASAVAMVLDVGGERVEGTAGQAGGAVGVATRAAAIDEADHPAHFVEESVGASAIGEIVEAPGQLGQAVETRPALVGALPGEVAENVCGG